MSQTEYTPIDIPVLVIFGLIVLLLVACLRSCADRDKPTGIMHEGPSTRYDQK